MLLGAGSFGRVFAGEVQQEAPLRWQQCTLDTSALKYLNIRQEFLTLSCLLGSILVSHAAGRLRSTQVTKCSHSMLRCLPFQVYNAWPHTLLLQARGTALLLL